MCEKLCKRGGSGDKWHCRCSMNMYDVVCRRGEDPSEVKAVASIARMSFVPGSPWLYPSLLLLFSDLGIGSVWLAVSSFHAG